MNRSGFAFPVNYGTVFRPDSAKLYLFRPEEGIQVIRAWPFPRAWRKLPGEGWKGFHPELHIPRSGSLESRLDEVTARLQLPSDPLQPTLFPEALRPPEFAWLIAQKSILSWYLSIPMEICRRIRKFPAHQWDLLRLVAACGKPALDLIDSTPALAVALAHSRSFRSVSHPLRSARALLAAGRSQTGIAAWLGFPGTPGTIRLLRKLDRRWHLADALYYLRRIAQEETLRKRCNHLPRITRSILRIVSDPALNDMAAPKLLHQLAEHPFESAVGPLKDILRMRCQLGEESLTLPRFSNLEVMHLHHDRLMARVWAKEGVDCALPSPPDPGNESIQPIRTRGELVEEGRLQQNCVSSYFPEIRSGRLAIYRVLAPERCTLSLRLVGREPPHWALGELRLERNQKPAQSTFHAVQAWSLGISGSSAGVRRDPSPDDFEEEF